MFECWCFELLYWVVGYCCLCDLWVLYYFFKKCYFYLYLKIIICLCFGLNIGFLLIIYYFYEKLLEWVMVDKIYY